MGLEFPTNLLISGKSSSKILFAGTEETEETVSESVFSSETISFLEIVRFSWSTCRSTSTLSFNL